MAHHSTVEADKMLDVYIHDYLVKRKYGNSARTFQTEAKIPTKPAAIDTPGGFLSEWWSVFWDIFIARYRWSGPNNEPLLSKPREQLQQQKWPQNSQQQLLQQMHMQLVLQKHIEQQQLQRQCQGQLVEAQLQHGTASNALAEQKLGMSYATAQKMSDEALNPQNQDDVLSEAQMKRYMLSQDSGKVGLLSDAMHTSIVRSAVSRDQPSGQLGHDTPVGNLKSCQGVKDQKHQPLASKDLKNLMISPSPRYTGLDGSLTEVIGSNQAVNTLPLKGWPLMFYERLLQNNQCHQQFMQPIPLGSTSENSECQIPPADRAGAASGSTDDITISKTSREYDQVSKKQPLKKRKQPMSFTCPPECSGAANTPALTPNSAPSTPSTPLTNTTGDMLPIPDLPPKDFSSKAALDQLTESGPLEANVAHFLSPDNPGSAPTGWSDTTLLEIGTMYTDNVKCCGISSNGKLIATGGVNRKVVLWCTESRKERYQFEQSAAITDLCFGSRLPRLATSSVDKTVKIWNVDNQDCPIQTFMGHSGSVISVDLHPRKEDLVCSCDDDREIRYWSIRNGACTGVLKVGATQVRFQPTHGRYLAAAVGNGVTIVDIETQTFRYPLKDHATDVLCVCWNSSGEYLASLSEDSIRVWKIGSCGQQKCMHELSITGKKFRCCAFHPCQSSLLVIGSNESLELWHMAENKMMTALGQPTKTLAVSNPSGLVASVGEDNFIKLTCWGNNQTTISDESESFLKLQKKRSESMKKSLRSVLKFTCQRKFRDIILPSLCMYCIRYLSVYRRMCECMYKKLLKSFSSKAVSLITFLPSRAVRVESE
ncbi:transcriptional corepressor LEUNIG isoform X3 [Coffea arabica]|uniref:Transcriptional corepressor LEUNIG isoform X3 n=1 Tax=Coffea arabica TaxID=13443 RepID=A0ABM4UN88_COFAR